MRFAVGLSLFVRDHRWLLCIAVCAMNLFRHAKYAKVVRSDTTSIWIAFVAKQKNIQVYICFGKSFSSQVIVNLNWPSKIYSYMTEWSGLLYALCWQVPH